MIIYFSGTGNTRYCAESLGEKLGERLHELEPSELRHPQGCMLKLEPGERLIVMFPTHGWGLPPYVEDYLRAVDIDADSGTEVWMVTTCGDDIGKTADRWRRLMVNRDFRVCSAFSIQMPNTYVCMKGFDVDSEETEERKLKAVPARIDAIAARIAAGDAGSDDVTEGKFAWIKSNVIRPWFVRYKMSARKFYASEDCNNCGLCRRVCPLENIIPGNAARPAWGNHCAMCLRCYHSCPSHSIHYAGATHGKGQYRRFLKLFDGRR